MKYCDYNKILDMMGPFKVKKYKFQGLRYFNQPTPQNLSDKAFKEIWGLQKWNLAYGAFIPDWNFFDLFLQNFCLQGSKIYPKSKIFCLSCK